MGGRIAEAINDEEDRVHLSDGPRERIWANKGRWARCRGKDVVVVVECYCFLIIIIVGGVDLRPPLKPR